MDPARRARQASVLAALPLALCALAFLLPSYSPDAGWLPPPALWPLRDLTMLGVLMPPLLGVAVLIITVITGRRRGEPPRALALLASWLAAMAVPLVTAAVIASSLSGLGSIGPVAIATCAMAGVLCAGAFLEDGWRRLVRVLAAFALLSLLAVPLLFFSSVGSAGWLYGGAILILVPLSAWGVWPAK